MRINNNNTKVIYSALFLISILLSACGGGGGSSGTPTPVTLTSMAITPATATVAKNLNASFTATGTYSNASTADITSQVTWASGNTSVATINSSSGVATGVAVGTTTVTASANGITSSAASLTVNAAVITGISISPTTPSTPQGTPITFTATGTYSDGSTGNVSGSVTWSSSNATVATLNASGIASTLAQGITTVTASANGMTSSAATLTVTAPMLTAIAINPISATVTKGLTTNFTAIGTYTDATTADITSQVTWASGNTSVATINSTTGIATGVAVGTTTVTATLNGMTSSAANLTVTTAVITSISISPTSASAPKDVPVTFTATATYSDGSTSNVSGSVLWGSSSGVATINASGVATGVFVGGTAYITATLINSPYTSNSASLTVTAPLQLTVSGTVTGLVGSAVLLDNGVSTITVAATGTIQLISGVTYGTPYNLVVLTQPTGQTCSITNGSGTLLTTNVTNVSVTCSNNSYAIGGTVSGLVGSVVLQDNAGDNLTVAANGTFTFATPVVNGNTYTVTVLNQPTGQTCSVSTGAGTISGNNITNVAVVCSTNSYSVGGTASGLTGSVVLQDNNGDNLAVASNGVFTFATPVANGSPYSVTVLTQPSGQSCSVASGTGTISAANVSNVAITCATNSYTIGGTVAGLNGSVVLQDNGGDNLTVATNGSLQFATAVAYGNPYNVTVLTQPSGQTCSVTSGNGTVSGNVTNVSMACTNNSYTVGGSVTGLIGSVVLQDNGGDNLTVSAIGTFTFATPIVNGNTYSVTVLTQPSGQTCSVSTGSGTISAANVTNMAVVCATNSYSVGGSVSGLTGSMVLQNNLGDNFTVTANGTFTFATPVASGSPYSVSVLIQPTNQGCSVTSGSGTISAANVTNVAITCSTNTYTIGGTISGLTGSVVLQDNGGDNLTVSANGTFTFATPVASGSPYSVTVLTQPSGQTCVSSGSGTVSGNVTNVSVVCATNYSVGGTVSGLVGSVVLQDNNGDNLTVSAIGAFTFATKVASGSAYSVTVLTQPASQTCSVSSGSGTISGGNVTGIAITCIKPMVALSSAFAQALKSDGSLMAWGWNAFGGLGDGTTTNRLSPIAVPSLTGVTAVAVGDFHTVALKSDGTVMTWGNNGNGQLADGTTTNRWSPVAVSGLAGVVAVTAGGNHTVALKSDGTVWTWGYNAQGQLGDGTTTDHWSPVAVPGLIGVVAVTAGGNSTVALKSDGTVMAWGDNTSGKLGDGSHTDRWSPVSVSGLTGVAAVSAGAFHTVALKSDGTVMAWGYNACGDLGDGTTIDRWSPVAVPGLTGVVAVSAGGCGTVALKSDGTVVTWGINNSGQVGDGTTTQRNSPVAVPGLTRVTTVSMGGYSTVARKSDGTVMAWGDNAQGQLGDGTTTQRLSPVVVPGLNL